MKAEVFMPKLGMTMREGTITQWLKKTGDPVALNETIAEIETEKLTNPVESPAAGILESLLFSEGDTAEVGAVIAVIETEAGRGETAESADMETAETASCETAEKVVLESRPYAGLRKIIGDRMTESLRVSPQGTMTTRADMTAVLKLKKDLESRGQKVSVTDILVKIASLALEKNPILNASIEDDRIVTYKSVNIGVAVGTDKGLFVPVIRHTEEKGLLQISAEARELVLKVRENRLQAEDMAGGTFTVSNLGMFDVDVVTAIINPPEAAILAIGSTRREAVVGDNDQLVIKPMTTLSFTGDHRVADGIPVMKFLMDMKAIMNCPEL